MSHPNLPIPAKRQTADAELIEAARSAVMDMLTGVQEALVATRDHTTISPGADLRFVDTVSSLLDSYDHARTQVVAATPLLSHFGMPGYLLGNHAPNTHWEAVMFGGDVLHQIVRSQAVGEGFEEEELSTWLHAKVLAAARQFERNPASGSGDEAGEGDHVIVDRETNREGAREVLQRMVSGAALQKYDVQIHRLREKVEAESREALKRLTSRRGRHPNSPEEYRLVVVAREKIRLEWPAVHELFNSVFRTPESAVGEDAVRKAYVRAKEQEGGGK